jgi:hypothetical protein
MVSKPRKGKLSVVPTRPATGPKPLRPLESAGQSLWNDLTAEYSFDDRAGLEILQQICTAVDQIEALNVEIARDGVTTQNGARGMREHPALRPLVALKSFVVRSLGKLGIGLEPVRSVGRPGLGTGW